MNKRYVKSDCAESRCEWCKGCIYWAPWSRMSTGSARSTNNYRRKPAKFRSYRCHFFPSVWCNRFSCFGKSSTKYTHETMTYRWVVLLCWHTSCRRHPFYVAWRAEWPFQPQYNKHVYDTQICPSHNDATKCW